VQNAAHQREKPHASKTNKQSEADVIYNHHSHSLIIMLMMACKLTKFYLLCNRDLCHQLWKQHSRNQHTAVVKYKVI